MPATRRAGEYRNLMIVVECRETAWSAVRVGLGLAQRHGASVTFALAIPSMARLSVAMPEMPVVTDDVAALEIARYGTQLLERARVEAERLNVQTQATAIDALDAVGEIVRRARVGGADAIVVACEPVNAVVRLLNGSLVPGLISAATVPVVVCPDQSLATATRRRRLRPRHKHRQGGVAELT